VKRHSNERAIKETLQLKMAAGLTMFQGCIFAVSHTDAGSRVDSASDVRCNCVLPPAAQRKGYEHMVDVEVSSSR